MIRPMQLIMHMITYTNRCSSDISEFMYSWFLTPRYCSKKISMSTWCVENSIIEKMLHEIVAPWIVGSALAQLFVNYICKLQFTSLDV